MRIESTSCNNEREEKLVRSECSAHVQKRCERDEKRQNFELYETSLDL